MKMVDFDTVSDCDRFRFKVLRYLAGGAAKELIVKAKSPSKVSMPSRCL